MVILSSSNFRFKKVFQPCRKFERTVFPGTVKFYPGSYCFFMICLPDSVVNYLMCSPWSKIHRHFLLAIKSESPRPRIHLHPLFEISSSLKCRIYLYCSSSFHSWLLWKQTSIVSNGFDEIRKYRLSSWLH